MARAGDSNITFGTTDTPYGFVENLKVDKTVQVTEAPNGQGQIVAAELYNTVYKCSGSYIFRNASDGPWDEVGTTDGITISEVSLTFYITSATKVWQLGQWLKINFEGVSWPNLGS